VANFLLLPAHKNIAVGGSAAADVEDEYLPEWLNDGIPGRPARGTSGVFLATIVTAASGNVNIAGVSHHNLLGAISLGGGLSGTITAAAVTPDGIPFATYTYFNTVGGVGSFTLSSSNADAWVVGEVFAGEATVLTLPYYSSDAMSYRDFARVPDMDLSSVAGYDPGFGIARTWEATWPALTVSEFDGLLDAFAAQRNRTRPTFVVRRADVNKAICGWITGLSETGAEAPNRLQVKMTFEEIPLVRWIG
jgi:hypothetical protein